MALSKDVIIKTRHPNLDTTRPMNVKASTEIFQGAIVALDATGTAIPAPATGAAYFMGISEDYYEEATGTATTDFPIQVRKGAVKRLKFDADPTAADLGKKVYYIGDDEVSLTIVASTGVAQSQVGVLHQIGASNWHFVDTSKAIT